MAGFSSTSPPSPPFPSPSPPPDLPSIHGLLPLPSHSFAPPTPPPRRLVCAVIAVAMPFAWPVPILVAVCRDPRRLSLTPRRHCLPSARSGPTRPINFQSAAHADGGVAAGGLPPPWHGGLAGGACLPLPSSAGARRVHASPRRAHHGRRHGRPPPAATSTSGSPPTVGRTAWSLLASLAICRPLPAPSPLPTACCRRLLHGPVVIFASGQLRQAQKLI